MRHAILGVGGVGGLVAAALARADHEVVLLMRPGSLAAYPGFMTVQSTVLGDFTVAVPAVPELDRAVDVLWVTPKAPQLEASLRAAPPARVGNAAVVTLLNGIDHLALLQQVYGSVIAGAVRVESDRISPGRIRQTSPFIRIELSDGDDIVEAVASTGITCTLGGDALSILWQKLAFLAPLALTTTAFSESLGDAREREVFQSCQSETVAVARAEGATIDAEALRTLSSGAPAAMRSSMQKDLAQGLPLELDAIAGPILRGGHRHGVETPATAWLTKAVEEQLPSLAGRAGGSAAVLGL